MIGASPKPKDQDPKELLRAAIFLLQRDEAREALKALERARALAPEDPIILSYLGLAMATSRTRSREAARLCERAVENGTFHPELYHNLGRVYLILGDKRKARLAFLQGLKLDRQDPTLLAELQAIGIRRAPPLPFLHREHSFNRHLGLALRRLGLR